MSTTIWHCESHNIFTSGSMFCHGDLPLSKDEWIPSNFEPLICLECHTKYSVSPPRKKKKKKRKKNKKQTKTKAQFSTMGFNTFYCIHDHDVFCQMFKIHASPYDRFMTLDTSVCVKMCRLICCFYSILLFLLPIKITTCKYNSTALEWILRHNND